VATVGTDEHGQAYNINADTVAGAIAEASHAEKLVYLTDIEGLRRRLDDPSSLIRQTTADELDELIADGTIAGGMIPKVSSCIRAVRHGVNRAHILDGRIAHVLLARALHRLGHRHHGARPQRHRRGSMTADVSTSAHGFDLRQQDHCPFMPVFGRPGSCSSVAGGPRCGTPTAPATSTSSRESPWCRSATPTRWWPKPSPAGSHPRARQQLLRQPGGGNRSARDQRLLSDTSGHDGQVFFTNSGAEANECAIKLARKHGGRGRHVVVSAFGSFHGRTLATLAATGQPAKHEPFAPMPEGFRHVAWGDLDAHAIRRRRVGGRRAHRADAG
jgi:hypothetical protein